MSLVEAFEAGLDEVLGDRFIGLIQYGAMCFPPSPISDFDAHVFVANPFDDEDRKAIEVMLTGLPGVPNREYLDVWYVTMDEASSATNPQTQLRPGFRDTHWALHRAHWHAGRFVLVRGPDPRTFVPEPTWDEIDGSLQAELSDIPEQITDEAAYVVLNLCRVLQTYETRDPVVGKFQSALWAHAYLDVDEHEVIRAAIDAYTTDTHAMAQDVRPFVDRMRERIAHARQLV